MGSEIETVTLDRISLPPIPGPLPPTFFTDIPAGSGAIFSTLLRTRPFRQLTNPVPAFGIRSGSENDIHERSCSLFKLYPTIAESIFIPPIVWQDLYQYFDATDLWTEGAGFLFHVLGQIVKINLTKRHFLENFAREWAFLNEARLTNIAPREDMLSLFQTSDDRACFDYGNMTAFDMEMLNSAIKWHCEAFRAKHVPALTLSRNEPMQSVVGSPVITPVGHLSASDKAALEPLMAQSTVLPVAPVQIVIEAQRIPYDMSADPYHHFGRPEYKLPLGLSNKQSHPGPHHWESSGNHSRAGSVLLHHNRNTNQSYGDDRESSHENLQRSLRNGLGFAGSHSIRLENCHQFNDDRRQNAHSGNPHTYLQRQPSLSNDPVYVLDPQRSLVSLHKEAFGVQPGNYPRGLPAYPSQRPQNVTFQARNSQECREDTRYQNPAAFKSNEMRLYNDGRFNHIDSSMRSMPREYLKHTARKSSWPGNDVKKLRSIQVTGFLIEASSAYYLEKLFSDCGEISSVSVVDEKFCAFINFRYPSSALAAINRLNGCSIEGGRSLTVRYCKGGRRKCSYSNDDEQRPMSGALFLPRVHDLPSPPLHDGAGDDRENQKFMYTNPPQNDSYSSLNRSYTIPANSLEKTPGSGSISQLAIPAVENRVLEFKMRNLPAKPPYSFPGSTWNDPSSTNSRPPCNIQGSARTPEKIPRGSGSVSTSANRRKEGVEHSGQSGGTHPYGSENSKPKRKTPKKQKALHGDHKNQKSAISVKTPKNGLQQSTLTQSSAKSALSPPTGFPVTEIKNVILVSSIDLPVLNTHSEANEMLDNRSIVNQIVELQDSSACSSECPQMDSSRSSSGGRSESLSSVGSQCCSASSQHCRPSVGKILHKNTLASKSTPATAPEVTPIVLAGFVDLKEAGIDNELVRQQNKKKPKNKKTSQKQPIKSNVEMDATVPRGPIERLNDGPMDRSTDSDRLHLKSSSNATSSSVTTMSYIISTSTGVPVSPIRTQSCKEASPELNTIVDSTSQESPRQQSNMSKESTEPKSRNNGGDDVFQDTKPVPARHTQDTKRLSKGGIGIGDSVTSSTASSNTSSKNARSLDFEENQTPTKKPQSRHRNNKSVSKASLHGRKENKKPSLSPTEILSDPSHWPALGSTKLRIDTKVSSVQEIQSTVKPLGERPLRPAPIRRDSMASVISQPPQIARRMTIDSPISPVSGGSPLWPVVKRWNGQGRLPVENCFSTSPASRNT